MTTKSFRLRFTFWLDMNKSDEAAIAETVDKLKSQRSFVSTIRDGIRLVCDLRAGRLDVLFELFPWVRAEFLEYMQTFQPPSDSAIQQRLDSLETLLLQQGNTPIETGPKKLLTSPGTNDKDDDLLIIKQARSERDSAQKFLDSAFNLIQ